MALERPARLPTAWDLPDGDGVPMESDLHGTQSRVYLIEPLRHWLAATGQTAFVSGNSFVYYRQGESPVGPDVYVVLGGVPRNQPSWVVWDEGDRFPDVVIELLSPSTEEEDRGRKFVLYRDEFRTRDYFLYSVEKQRLEGFRLQDGEYLPVHGGPGGRIPCTSLPLALGVHEGWLRWFTPEGELLLTGDEKARREGARAEEAHARAEEEHARAEEERRRADDLARRLAEAEEALRRLSPDAGT